MHWHSFETSFVCRILYCCPRETICMAFIVCSYLLYSRKCWYPAAGEEFRFVPVCFFGSRKWLELMFFFKCVYLWKEVDSNLISLFFLNFFISFFIKSDSTFPSFSLSTFTEDDSTAVTLVNKTENGFI